VREAVAHKSQLALLDILLDRVEEFVLADLLRQQLTWLAVGSPFFDVSLLG
jgi:hypothetical protein